MDKDKKQDPSYYGMMPAPVRYNNNLSSSEKLMYSEITALSNKNGYCHAKNSYFANLYNVTKQTVSGWFSSLKQEELVHIDYIRDGKQIKERRIYPLMDKHGRYYEKDEGGIKEKDNTPIKENPKDNTTSNNTTSNNTYIRELSINDFDEDEKVKRFTIYCWEQVKENYPDHNTVLEAKFNTWYDPLRLLIEKDGKSIKDAKELFDWATNDEFWKMNIRSTSKFRDKYEELDARSQYDNNSSQQQYSAGYLNNAL